MYACSVLLTKLDDIVASVATSVYWSYEMLFYSDVHWRNVRSCYVIVLFIYLYNK